MKTLKSLNIIGAMLFLVPFAFQPLQAQNNNTSFDVNSPNAISFHKTNDLDNYDNSYLTLYPNPAINEVNLSFNATRYNVPYEVRIINNSGMQLKAMEGNTLRGQNILKFNVGDFAPGIYYVKILTANDRETLRFIK